MNVRPLTKEVGLQLAEWRNASREALRTGWTTPAQQERFVERNFLDDYMYWQFEENVTLEKKDQRGMAPLAAGGFVHIERTIQRAEIALIVHPLARRQGFGLKCAEWILHEGFVFQNFKTIWGECHTTGPVAFWKKIADKYHAHVASMPNTFYWNGWQGSVLFSIDRGDYEPTDEARIVVPTLGSRVGNREDDLACTNT